MTDPPTLRDDDAAGETVLFECLAQYADLVEAGGAPQPEDFRARLGEHYERFCQMLEIEGVLGRTVDPTANVFLPIVSPSRYSEFRPVGEGGMGLVYWAIDNTLNREVAFKVVKPRDRTGPGASPSAPLELASPASGTPASKAFETLRQRFLQEAWVTSGMNHPGIVPVYELGETSHGIPYYTMRFVKGERTLAAAIDEAKEADLEARLQLLEPFLKVCDTVRYAHSRGVVHRDLKPQNIALGEFGEVVVLDWGLAKLDASQDLTESVWQERLTEYRSAADLQTATSALGTPGYMSPEAARGDVAKVDERSDVYSLGVILFEVLTGQMPMTFDTFREFLTKLLKEDPLRADEVDENVPTALADISQSTLQRDPDARLNSVRELAEAIRGWQSQSAAEREAARHIDEARVHFTAAEELQGADLLRQVDHAALAIRHVLDAQPEHADALAMRTHVEALRARGLKQREQVARKRVLRIGGVAALVLVGILIAVFTQLQSQRELADERLYWSHVNEGRALRSKSDVGRRLKSLEAFRQALEVRPDGDLRQDILDTLPLWDLKKVRSLEHEHGAMLAAVDPAFQRYAWMTNERDLSIRDLRTGEETAILPSPGPELHWVLKFHPDGRHLAAKYSEPSIPGGFVHIWDVETGKIVFRSKNTFHERAMDWSPTGDRIALGRADGTLEIIAFPSGEVLEAHSFGGFVPHHLRFSPDGEHVAASSYKTGLVVVINMEGDNRLQTFLPTSASTVTWRHDGRSLAVASYDGNIYVLRLGLKQPVQVLRGHTKHPTPLWSRTGAALITSGWDRAFKVWDPHTGEVRLSLPYDVSNMHFSADDTLIALSFGKELQIWELVRSRAWRRIPPHYWSSDGVAFSTDGRLATTTEAKSATLQFWETSSGRRLGALRDPGSKHISSSQFVGSRLMTTGASGLRWYTLREDGGKLRFNPAEGPGPKAAKYAERCALSGDGRWIALAGTDHGKVFVWRADGKGKIHEFPHPRPTKVALDSTGAKLAVSSWRETWMEVRDVASGKLLKRITAGKRTRAVFDHSDRYLIVSDDRQLRVFDVSTWQVVARRTAPPTDFAPVLHPSEDVLATSDNDGAIHLLHPVTLEVLARLKPPDPGGSFDLKFSPDGRYLGQARPKQMGLEIWDLKVIREKLESMGLPWIWPDR